MSPARSATLARKRARPQELRHLGVANGRTEHASTARLLLIGDDPALMPEQLRRAFPAPMHRVQVADTGHGGLEQVRIDAPDVDCP